MRNYTPIQRPEGEDPWARVNGLSRYERITLANIRLCRAYVSARDEDLKRRIAEAGERTYAWLHDACHEHRYEDCPTRGETEVAAALEQALRAMGAPDGTVPLLNLNEHLSGDESRSVLEQIADSIGKLPMDAGIGFISGDAAQDVADALKRMGIDPDGPGMAKVRIVQNRATGENVILKSDAEWEAFKAEHGVGNIQGADTDTPKQQIFVTPELDGLDALRKLLDDMEEPTS